VHETEGALILNGSYDIAFNIDLALKDLGFALGFGREFGVPLDLASDDRTRPMSPPRRPMAARRSRR
jgi:3-hydroxyisobutyrate dehydrogenase-like beta-hydroxyacid dehydrogenase